MCHIVVEDYLYRLGDMCYRSATIGVVVWEARRRGRSCMILSMKVARAIVFFCLLRSIERLFESITPGKVALMWENVKHSSRVSLTVSIAPSSQKGHMVAKGSSLAHFPVSHHKLCDPVRIDATFLCVEMFIGSRR